MLIKTILLPLYIRKTLIYLLRNTWNDDVSVRKIKKNSKRGCRSEAVIFPQSTHHWQVAATLFFLFYSSRHTAMICGTSTIRLCPNLIFLSTSVNRYVSYGCIKTAHWFHSRVALFKRLLFWMILKFWRLIDSNIFVEFSAIRNTLMQMHFTRLYLICCA